MKKLLLYSVALSAGFAGTLAAEAYYCDAHKGSYSGEIDRNIWTNPVSTCIQVCNANKLQYLGWTDGDPVPNDPCNNTPSCVCDFGTLWDDLRSNNINKMMFDAMTLLYGNPPGQGGTTNSDWQANPSHFYKWLANQKDSNRNTAMANAAARGYANVVAALVANGATTPDTNACGWVGKQAMGANAQAQNLSIIRNCVCKGDCSALDQQYQNVFTQFTQNYLPKQPNGQQFIAALQAQNQQ